ncbi:MAG: hypothetical protein ACTHWO_06090 [Nesterenkonia sp.]
MAKGKRRGGRTSKWQRGHRPLSTSFLAPSGIAAGRVSRRDGEYHLRHISAAAAHKPYTCPGCGLEISPGTAHVVAWPADAILGDEFGASQRRHWHQHCWRISG